MTGLAAPRPGRILRPVRPEPPAGLPRTAADATRSGPGTLLLLIFCLPLFVESFQYIFDVLPLYALTKVWPILTLPLILHALLKADLPYRLYFIVLMAYVLGVTPILSMMQLGNGFVDAMATTAKVWSYGNYFGLAAFLLLLKPSEDVLRRALLWLGAGTFVVMVLLWLAVPPSHYASDPHVSKLFMFDFDRGDHIYMPMFFGLYFVFYLGRLFWRRRSVLAALAILGCFAALQFIYKERLAMLSAILAVLFGLANSLPRRSRLPILAAIVLAGGAALGYGLMHFSKAHLNSELGGSSSVRFVTINLILNFIEGHAARWLFGVGSITRFSSVTLSDLFSDKQFYLADVGWLGIMFEYGAIGALLIAGVYALAFRLTLPAAGRGDLLAGALADYTFYISVTSLVYSAVFQPGEVVSIMALAWYLARLRGDPAAGPPEVPGADDPMPKPRRGIRLMPELSPRGQGTA